VWSALRSRSAENARRFRWHENADRIAKVYQEVAERTAASLLSSLPSKAAEASALKVSGQLREERTIALGHRQ
jgi:hypothetical protein